MASWLEARQGHFRIRYKVADRHGRSIVTHLCIETHHDAEEPQSITAAALRQIKPRDLARGYAERLLSYTDTDGLFRSVPVEPYSTEHIEQVAGLVRFFGHGRMPGMSPAEVVQSTWGVSPATAHRWIARAREQHPDLPQRRRGPKPKGGTDHG